MSQRRIRIGLLGCGTVGGGVVELLRRNGEDIARRTGIRLEVEKVLVRELDRPRGLDRSLLTDRAAEVVQNGVDVVVELLGGIEPALSLVSDSLQRGKPVVTANKQLLAHHHPRLRELSSRHVVPLAYEASACAGLPVIRSLSSALAGDRVRAFEGVVNGTSNYILSRLEEGHSFETALETARRRGFAEADASADIDGDDAAEKTAILCGEAFGRTVAVSDLEATGIRGWTPSDVECVRRLGYAVKLTTQACLLPDGRISARVGPTLVPRGSALARVEDEQNALIVYGEASGALTFTGKGAGAGPTAAAVLSDILDVAGGVARPCGGSWELAERIRPADSSWFVRVVERPDAHSPHQWIDRLHRAGIETRWIQVQRNPAGPGGRAVSLLTTACLEENLRPVIERAAAEGSTVLARVAGRESAASAPGNRQSAATLGGPPATR
ncbi:MAG: homoserine dehydrogenase [Phycisphaerales bacterium]|nr:homoserine dehydrogenase [Phycisphaerales bacterium]